jgi:hypothetical protein
MLLTLIDEWGNDRRTYCSGCANALEFFRLLTEAQQPQCFEEIAARDDSSGQLRTPLQELVKVSV